ncbi:alanine racemase [Motiliproteus sp. SC1-56]|uniref:alanine racemase n=1 Tax=Motiliproteus sp. SC1-56 TaxID=2799565 RepID=UPI001A8E7B02|nr:alanine racemase [Motiliproteus sp. SC1-56]
MTRAAKATIDLDAIRHNYRLAKRLAPAARALAVVKADAYGHGAVEVAQALAPEADGFGVACLEEAILLRDSGIKNRLVLLEGFFEPAELAPIAQLELDIVIHSLHQVAQFLAAPLARPLRVWLKLDSGMHRVGLDPSDLRSAFAQLKASDRAAELLLMTHFAQSDEDGCRRTAEQLALFQATCRGLPAPWSLANSPTLLAWPQAHGDWTRPGMMLYGADPLETPNAESRQLQSAMELSSELIAIRDLPAGEPIGYGARFRCQRPTRVGVVAMGYGDGYPRHARDGTPVLVNGQRCPLAGRVSMDMLTVDLTDLTNVNIGDPVCLWGPHLPVAEVARWCDSIPYQLVTTLTPRVKRHYRNR